MKYLKIFLGVILLLGLGYATTIVFIDDGLAQFQNDPQKMAAAQQFLQNERSFKDDDWADLPWYDYFLPKIKTRVTAVKKVSVPEECSSEKEGYSETVRVYTLFALPLRTFQNEPCHGFGLQ